MFKLLLSSIIAFSFVSFSAHAENMSEVSAVYLCFNKSASASFDCSLGDLSPDEKVDKYDRRRLVRYERKQILYALKHNRFESINDHASDMEKVMDIFNNPDNYKHITRQPSSRVRLHLACLERTELQVQCSDYDLVEDGEINALDMQAVLNQF